MKRTVMSSLLAAALVGSAAIPALAEPPKPPIQMQDHGMQMKGRPDMKGSPEMAMADRLSTLETLIGVTAEQEPAWRGYTVALLDFMQAGGPGARPDAPPPRAEGAPEGAQAPAPRPLMAEMMADRAIARADSAEKLKSAVVALKSALTPEQLETLAQAEMPPHRGGPGHDGPRPGGKAPGGDRPAQPPAAE